MNPRLATLLIALSVLALSGCGNKGPLVQAPKPPALAKPSTAPAPVDGQPEQVDPANPVIVPVPEQSTPVDPPSEPDIDNATAPLKPGG